MCNLEGDKRLETVKDEVRAVTSDRRSVLTKRAAGTTARERAANQDCFE